MSRELWIRLALFVPVIAGAGVYCWRSGIRWSRNVTIKGIPARIAAIFCFLIAAIMVAALIFPSEAKSLMDALDRKTSTPRKERGLPDQSANWPGFSRTA